MDRFHPTSDSSTWPTKGSLWYWVHEGYGPIHYVDGHRKRIELDYGTIVFFVKVHYCTKEEITFSFLAGDKLICWALRYERWSTFFEKVETQ